MQIRYFGFYEDFLSDAFRNSDGQVSVVSVSQTATQVVVRQANSGLVTTFSGTGLSASNNFAQTSGTINGATIRTADGDVVASLSGFNWSLAGFAAALQAQTSGNNAPMAALVNASGQLVIDASGANQRLDMGDWFTVAGLLVNGGRIIGTGYGDIVRGTAGNDFINVAANPFQEDHIDGSLGNDTISFENASDQSFYWLDYEDLNDPVRVSINGVANTGTVQGNGFTDTLVQVRNALNADGLGVEGTTGNDVFTVNPGTNGWFNLRGQEGNDTYYLTLQGSGRISYNFGSDSAPSTGIILNLATGTVSNDGFGGTDQITVLGGSAQLEIRATDNNDALVGSSRNESFILEQGSDTLDGGGGFDRLRYDRSGVGAVSVDLEAGVATGTWDGNAFRHTIRNVEVIRGSRDGNDTIAGATGADTLSGYGGHDNLNGRGGNDYLIGAGGNDTLVGGFGRDQLIGGDGNDLLDATAGDLSSEGIGDFIRPGSGANRIFGNADIWAEGQAADLSYGDLGNSGNLTITVGQFGGGTVTSGAAPVNDTFTYIHYFQGAFGHDTFNGNNTSGWRGWAGLDGNDTINGGGGDDLLDYLWDHSWGAAAGGVSVTFTGDGTGTARDAFGGTDVFTSIEEVQGTEFADTITGHNGAEMFLGQGGDDQLSGGASNDTLDGGNGSDTLIGGAGRDSLIGGTSEEDLRDVLYGGDDNDFLDGGFGNDQLRGDGGSDTIVGGFGVDEIFGGSGNDELTGQAWSDLIFGGDGMDFINGGFGFDRLNGGAGSDRFYHTGDQGHGSDWIQDYTASQGDSLVFGGTATRDQFQVNFNETANAGAAGVQEAFVIYRPTGQILWALVDGQAQGQINLLIDGQSFDLLS